MTDHPGFSSLGRSAAFRAFLVAVLGLCAAGCPDPEQQVSSRDPGDRIRAIREMADRGSEADVQRLAEAAAHEDAGTAVEAVAALARTDRMTAVAALSRVATKDRRPQVRQMAVSSLTQHKQPEAVQALREVVATDENRDVQGEAAVALGRVGTLDDVALLLGIVQADEDPVVVSRAVAGIERLVSVRFGYDPAAPADERALARRRVLAEAPALVARIRQELAKKGETR